MADKTERHDELDSEAVFKTYLEATFPLDAKRTRSAIIRRPLAQRIINRLKGEQEDKLFRHYVKKSGFKLLDLPAVGVRDALVIELKGEKKVCSKYDINDCQAVHVRIHVTVTLQLHRMRMTGLC